MSVSPSVVGRIDYFCVLLWRMRFLYAVMAADSNSKLLPTAIYVGVMVYYP